MEDSKDTSENLRRVSAALDALHRASMAARERLGEGLQLTRTQLEILMLLSGEAHTTGDLARKLFLTQSAVTQTVETLVRRGLVERLAGGHDRRVVHLRLTDEGTNNANRIRELKRKHLQLFISTLEPHEVEVLIAITGKMTTLLEEAGAHPKPNKEETNASNG